MHHLKNILVPVDFSDGALAMVKQAGKLAALYQAKVTLLHVIPDLPGVFQIHYGLNLSQFFDRGKICEKSMEVLEKVGNENLPLSVQRELVIHEGRVDFHIGNTAEEAKADLILMFTEGHHRGDLRVLGTHASRILSHAPCPVLSINDQKERVSFKKILIPVERKFGIRELRRYVKSYFSLMDPDLHLISILPSSADADDKKDELTFLEQERTFLAKDGITKVTLEVSLSDDIAGEILRTADFQGSELVMMNTHGRSGLGRLVSGSVTESVVSHSKVPVITIRPGRAEVQDFKYHSWFPV